jgi:hypothetical protein
MLRQSNVNKAKIVSIKQINAAYLVNEDRILLRFNTPEEAEYRLWITRRVGLFMLVATTHLLTKQLEQSHAPDTAKAIDAFEKEALVEASKIANTTPNEYQSGIQFPLGAEPILVMDVSCSLLQNNASNNSNSDAITSSNQDIISIDFALPGGANLNLKLASNMVRAITLLLDQLRQQAGWGEAVFAIQNDGKTTADLNEKNSHSSALH